MKKLVFLLASSLMVFTGSAEIKVSDVQAFSGYPWKEVVVGYTITGTDENAGAIRLMATDKSANKSYIAKTLTDAKFTEGRHVVRWNAAAEGVKFSSANVVFSISVVPGVQLWKDGPYWAECNVGATNPEEYGYYFWWGDTVGYKRVGSSWNAVDGSKTEYSFDREYFPKGNLTSKNDAATRHLGVPWRMPTSAEWDALADNCTTKWTTRNGVYGWLVTGKSEYASRSIFLPAAGCGNDTDLLYSNSKGYYWSSTHISDSSLPNAWCLNFSSSGLSKYYYLPCELGQSIRPLRAFAQ